MVVSTSNARVSQMTRLGVGEVKNMLEPNHFKAVLTWLSPLTPRQKQKEVLGNAEPYSWVFGSDKFRAWREGDVQTLWCYGAPGTGKSVLAASVYAEMAKQHGGSNVAVVIAFCSFDSAESQSPLKHCRGLSQAGTTGQGRWHPHDGTAPVLEAGNTAGRPETASGRA